MRKRLLEIVGNRHEDGRILDLGIFYEARGVYGNKKVNEFMVR